MTFAADWLLRASIQASKQVTSVTKTCDKYPFSLTHRRNNPTAALYYRTTQSPAITSHCRIECHGYFSTDWLRTVLEQR